MAKFYLISTEAVQEFIGKLTFPLKGKFLPRGTCTMSSEVDTGEQVLCIHLHTVDDKEAWRRAQAVVAVLNNELSVAVLKYVLEKKPHG